MKNIIEYLKGKRIEKNISQVYISDCLNVSTSTVSRWETCKCDMSISQIKEYASCIDLDVKEVFAIYANNDTAQLNDVLIKLDVEIYSSDAYTTLLELIARLGIKKVSIKNTNIL